MVQYQPFDSTFAALSDATRRGVLEQLVRSGVMRRDDSVVLFNTGAGWLYR